MDFQALAILPPEKIDDVKLDMESQYNRSAGRGKCITLLELASWLAGEPHGNDPACVDRVISGFLLVASGRHKPEGLRPLAREILGTRTEDIEIMRKRLFLAADYTVHVALAFSLKAARIESSYTDIRLLDPISDLPSAKKALKLIEKLKERAEKHFKDWGAGFAKWKGAKDHPALPNDYKGTGLEDDDGYLASVAKGEIFSAVQDGLWCSSRALENAMDPGLTAAMAKETAGIAASAGSTAAMAFDDDGVPEDRMWDDYLFPEICRTVRAMIRVG